jgi:anti-sigma regulatory factor (Ser/Thr protein kinase)
VNREKDVLRVPADVRQLAAIRGFVRDRAGQAGADQQAVDDLVTAVDESVTNAIVHGYHGTSGTVEIEVARNGTSLVVRMRDHAPGFDPTSVPAPDLNRPLEEQRLGGLGVLLARQLADSVSYRHTGSGNELTLTKELVTREGGSRC